MEDDEREATIYHGTTLLAAQQLLSTKQFDLRTTYFTPDLELAAYFAKRSCDKVRLARKPAILRVVCYESDLAQWKRNGWVTPKPFNQADQPYLRNKNELVFLAEAVRLLNVYMFKDQLIIQPER